jgi:hypothetical protein
VKKMIGIAVALVVILAVIRRFGPALKDRAMTKCEEMMGARAEAREEFADSRTSTEEPTARVAV